MSEKVREQSFWEKTKRFFEPVKYNKRVTLFLFAYFIVQFSFGVLFIFFVQSATEALESGNNIAFYEVLREYAILFLCTFILVIALHRGWIYSYNRYREFIEKEYFPKYITFDQNIQERVGTGKSIAIISKGIKMWGTMIDRIFIEGLSFIIAVGVTLYLLTKINIFLGVNLCVLLFLGTFVGIVLNNRVMRWRRKRNELDNIWSKQVVKIIMAKIEILQSGKIHKEIETLHELHEGQIFYNGKMSPYLVPFFIIGSCIITILLYTIFLYFGELYFKGEVTLGYIASVAGAILMMETVFLNVLDFLKNFGKEFTEVQNLWDFFDTTPQIQGYEEGNNFVHKKGEIKLQNINYGYDAIKKVFENFSLKIPGSQITAFVGPSGGGKSTLVKLIAGYIKADSGEVIIDSQKLSETSLKSYYADIGYLTQEPSVFDGTVRENLMYGINSYTIPSSQPSPLEEKVGATSEMQPSSPLIGEEVQRGGDFNNHLKHIISLAHCEFIYDLPNGLDTEIGERGVKLSGGQKQRLAIAKIFLKDPKIIILDEPTSALDSLSEKKITEAMHNLFENRSVLVIAHRLQTVKHADDIIVIQNGEVIERGTHKALIKNKGFYKEMLDLQSGF